MTRIRCTKSQRVEKSTSDRGARGLFDAAIASCGNDESLFASHKKRIRNDVDTKAGSEQHLRQSRVIAVAFVNWSGDVIRRWFVRKLHALGLLHGTKPMPAPSDLSALLKGQRCALEMAPAAFDDVAMRHFDSVTSVQRPTFKRVSIRLPLVVARAVQEGSSVVHRVVGCCPTAWIAGIRIGMTLPQAEMIVSPTRDSEEIVEMLENIRAGQCKQQQTRAGEGTSEELNRVRSSLQSRLIVAHDRLIAIREDEALEARMLLRLGRCLERWIPDVSMEPARQGACGLADITWSLSGDHELQTHGQEHGYGNDVTHELIPDVMRGQTQAHVAGSWRVPAMPALIGSLAGCEQLFRRLHGSERLLMERIRSNFSAFGMHVRVASASTTGAALAVARFGSSESPQDALRKVLGNRPQWSQSHSGSHAPRESLQARSKSVFAIRTGEEAEALSMLPVEALGIHEHEVEALRSVEVSTIGQLACLRRSGVAARFHEQRDDGRSGCGQIETARFAEQPTLFSESKSSFVSEFQVNPSNACHQDLSQFHGDFEEGASHTSSRNRRRTKHVDTAGVLSLLDQALGNFGAVGSARIFLRHRDPLRLSHEFDGPVAHRETVLIACASMIDQLCHELSRRGEGLRGVRWILRHADLPADLSTDHLGSAATSVVRNSSRASECLQVERSSRKPLTGDALTGEALSTPRTSESTASYVHEQISNAFDMKSAAALQPHMCAEIPGKSVHIPRDVGWRETCMDIQFQNPAISRIHHWNMLRPRLEQVCLAHGIESVTCTVESSIWLRYKQRAGIFVSRAGEAHVRCREGQQRVQVPSVSQRENGSRREWMELVAARIGAERVLARRGLGRLKRQSRRATSLDSSTIDAADGDRSMHMQWPWQVFPKDESARLRLMTREGVQAANGSKSADVPERISAEISRFRGFADAFSNRQICTTAYAAARAIAHRTVFIPPRNTLAGDVELCSAGEVVGVLQSEASRVQNLSARESTSNVCSDCGRVLADQFRPGLNRDRRVAPAGLRDLVLLWRGRTWRVDAIDGWQRIEEHWLGSCTQTSKFPEAQIRRGTPKERIAAERAVAPHDPPRGSVFSRVLVSDSLPCSDKEAQDHGGLWIQVRWPHRIRSAVGTSNVVRHDFHALMQYGACREQVCDAKIMHSMQEKSCTPDYSVEVSTSGFCNCRRCECHACLSLRANKASVWNALDFQDDPMIRNWIEGCMAALESGLDLTVEGAWG